MAYYVAKKADQQDQESFISAYNQVGYQIGTIGNHEFDYGLNYLNFMMQHSNRHFVCANIVDNHNEPLLADPYTIIDVANVKVGFLGLTTTSTKNGKRERPQRLQLNFRAWRVQTIRARTQKKKQISWLSFITVVLNVIIPATGTILTQAKTAAMIFSNILTALTPSFPAINTGK